MDISIVVPNYNGEKLLEKSLPRLLEILKNYKDGETEIIIVDDASTDKSVGLLKKYDVEIFINDKNLGFSSTVNRGVKKAKGEIVILLNTDVFPEKDFLNPLLEHFKDPKVFAVGCMDKSIEGDRTILRGRGLGAWKRGLLVHRRGEVNKADTLWVSGGSGAFRKTAWDRLSGLNELYDPFYYEDIDLSYRALKAGYKILFEPKSVVYHEHEKGAVKSKHSSFQIKTIAYRNQFIFVWENATDWDLQLLHFLWLPYHFAKAILRGDTAFVLGFLKAIILLPKIIKSSLGYQRLFIKKDKEII